MYKNVQCKFPPGRTVILERLGEILDPELDESILELGFIRSIEVCDRHATVAVRLPTSWCAANFVYMMAEDIRHALLGVEGIQEATVCLGDHFAAAELEAAVNAGQSFEEAFPGEGCGSLSALRETFLHKGFTSRQERFLKELKAAGFSAEEICRLRVGDVSVRGDNCLVRQADGEWVRVGSALQRYLDRRAELGLDCGISAPLIVDLDGQPLSAAGLEAYYEAARTVRVSMEANGSFCRALLEVQPARV